jgi:hypothetical protein
LRRILLLALLMAGCAELEPDPRPGPIRAMEPRPNPPVVLAPPPSGRDRVRQNPWLTRSWEELKSDERSRVTARLRHTGRQPDEPISAFWDLLGLPDRTALVFGTPALPPPRLPPRQTAPMRETMAGGG